MTSSLGMIVEDLVPVIPGSHNPVDDLTNNLLRFEVWQMMMFKRCEDEVGQGSQIVIFRKLLAQASLSLSAHWSAGTSPLLWRWWWWCWISLAFLGSLPRLQLELCCRILMEEVHGILDQLQSWNVKRNLLPRKYVSLTYSGSQNLNCLFSHSNIF